MDVTSVSLYRCSVPAETHSWPPWKGLSYLKKQEIPHLLGTNNKTSICLWMQLMVYVFSHYRNKAVLTRALGRPPLASQLIIKINLSLFLMDIFLKFHQPVSSKGGGGWCVREISVNQFADQVVQSVLYSWSISLMFSWRKASPAGPKHALLHRG